MFSIKEQKVLKLLTAAILMTASMVNAKVLEVNSPELARDMMEQSRPVIIMFGANWCPACRDAKPAFIKAEKLYKGKVVFVYLDVDRVNTSQLPIDRIPSYAVAKDIKDINSMKESLNQLESRDVEGLKKYIKEFTNIAP